MLPAAQHQRGFHGMLRLTDHATRKGVNITLWDTEEDLVTGETSGYLQDMLAKVSPFLMMPPFREVFQVSLMVEPK